MIMSCSTTFFGHTEIENSFFNLHLKSDLYKYNYKYNFKDAA